MNSISKIDSNQEDDPNVYSAEYLDEQFSSDLNGFEGVERYLYRITDDLRNLVKLIDLIGENVVKEEKEFREIEKAENHTDYPLSKKVLDARNKKMYKPFSYKAMFMLTQSMFENGVSDFRRMLINSKRLVFLKKENSLMDTLKELKKTPSISGHLSKYKYSILWVTRSHTQTDSLERTVKKGNSKT